MIVCKHQQTYLIGSGLPAYNREGMYGQAPGQVDIAAFKLSGFAAAYTTTIEEPVQCRKHVWSSQKFCAQNIRITGFEESLDFFISHVIYLRMIMLDGKSVIQDVGITFSDTARITDKFPDG